MSSHRSRVSLTEWVEDGGDNVCFFKSMQNSQTSGLFHHHGRSLYTKRYELLNKINLLSIQTTSEKRSLLSNWSSSSSER